MRTVSFVDCFELEFEGSVSSKAMLVADVDNDNVSMSLLLALRFAVRLLDLTVVWYRDRQIERSSVPLRLISHTNNVFTAMKQ